MSDYYFDKAYGRDAASNAVTGGGAVSATMSIGSDSDALFSPVGIQCSGDAGALVTIESPAGTVKWRKRFAAAFSFSEGFLLGAIKGTKGQDMLVKVSGSTTNAEANIQAAKLKA